MFKGGGNHRGSEGLIEDGCKQTSKLISAGPQDTASNPSGSPLSPLAPSGSPSSPLVPSNLVPPERRQD